MEGSRRFGAVSGCFGGRGGVGAVVGTASAQAAPRTSQAGGMFGASQPTPPARERVVRETWIPRTTTELLLP
jgi:hypothetical protein